MDTGQLSDLVTRVAASAKYRHVCRDVVERIGARELAIPRKPRAAIKATKRQLHQIGAAYFAGAVHYRTWLEGLRAAAASSDADALQRVCKATMAAHVSSRERAPFVERFFRTVLEDVGPVRSVLDIGCGLTPLAIPWMPLAPDALYLAVDMYTDLMAFVGQAMRLLGVRGLTGTRDVATYIPRQPVQVALLLKMVPCLEQQEKGAAQRLLDAIPAEHAVVSFPVQSLGGREKGMISHYDAMFEDLVRDRPWQIKRFLFPSELAFLISV